MELYFITDSLRTQPASILFLSVIGLFSLVKNSFRLLKWIHHNFLRPGKNLKRQYGSWAIVTGATDGIGKAFAFQLARQGLNLVLVSRNADKLDSVSKEINSAAMISREITIKTVAFDFTSDMTDGLRRIEEAIRGLDIGVLVNNVGATHGKAAYFDEVGEGVWGDVVKVNVEGTTRVSKVVMKGMVERGRGAVINIGSGASCVMPSFPLYSVYSATKM